MTGASLDTHQVTPVTNRSLANLRFPQAVEAEYWADRTRAFVPVLRISVGLILLFYVTFLGVDYSLYSRFVGSGTYLMVWGIATPTALMGIGITYTAVPPRWVRRGIFTATAINGFALVAAIIMSRLSGQAVPYEALLIYMVYVYFLLGTSNRAAMQLAFSVAAVYLVASWRTGLPTTTLFDHAFFMVVMISVGALASRIMELSDRKAWLNERRLRDLAERDALTGLLNQRAFFEQADASLQAARIANQEVSMLMLGVRHLGSYNHQLGHPAVDDSLRQLASELAVRIPSPQDRLARLGGEQFAIFLVDCSAQQTIRFAEQLCCDIDGLRIRHPGAPHGVITPLIGIFSARASDIITARAAAQTADDVLLRLRGSNTEQVAVSVASLT